MKYLDIAAQTYAYLRRFPTSDALADAVMLQAIYGLIWAPFEIRKFFVLTQQGFFCPWRRWNFLIWPLFASSKIAASFRHFDLSLRLRHDEKKARKTATIGSIFGLIWTAIILLLHVQIKKGPLELTEKEKQRRTEAEMARYESNQEEARETPWKPLLSPMQFGFLAISVGLMLNVLRCAIQNPPRAVSTFEASRTL